MKGGMHGRAALMRFERMNVVKTPSVGIIRTGAMCIISATDGHNSAGHHLLSTSAKIVL